MPATITWGGGSAPLIDLQAAAAVGVSPQAASCTFTAVGSYPPLAGDLTFSDGAATFTLRDCHLDRNGFRESATRAGRFWTLQILDRRWRWRIGPAARGQYNQLDARAKLIPKTVRSPHQLAQLLFAAMVEPVRWVVTGTFDAAAEYSVTVNEVSFTVPPGTWPSLPAVVADLAAQIAGSEDEAVAGKATAWASGIFLYIAAAEPEPDPDAEPYAPAPLPHPAPEVTAEASGLPAGGAWFAVNPIDLPGGLARPAADGIPPPGPRDVVVGDADDFYALGTNAPPSGTNPPAVWDDVPAALALAALGEQYGRVVVWDPGSDTTSLQVEGEGPGLPTLFPDGTVIPVTSSAPAIDPRQVPSAIVVSGAPTRYQVRLACRAVGRTGTPLRGPLSELSYAPFRDEQTMRVVFTGIHRTDTVYSLTLGGTTPGTPGAVTWYKSGATYPDMPAVYAAFAAAITANTDPPFVGLDAGEQGLTVTASSDGLAIEAVAPGYEFECGWGASTNARWEGRCTRGPIPVIPYPQSVTATFRGQHSPDSLYAVTVNGVTFETPGESNPTMADVCTVLAFLISGSDDPAVVGKVTATADGDTLKLVATTPGDPVEITTDGTRLVSTPEFTAQWKVTNAVGPFTTTGGKGFERCGAYGSALVLTTPQLDYRRAQELAEASIYRYYQVIAASPADGTPGIPVPAVDDRVTDRFRLVVQNSRPDQVVPRAGDANRIDPRTQQPFAAEFYDGYAKDRAMAVFGGIFQRAVNGGLWIATEATKYTWGNTPRRTQFYEPDVSLADPERQVFRFSGSIHRCFGQTFQPTDVVIETGVLVLDDVTRMPLRLTYTLPIPGGLGPPRTVPRDDVRLEVLGEYDGRHKLTGWKLLDGDGLGRAEYYAKEIAKTYASSLAQVSHYVGLVPVMLSGVVRSAEWAMSAAGFTTTAAANSEHSTAIVTYPRRRMAENLPPDALGALQNVLSAPANRGVGNALSRLGVI